MKKRAALLLALFSQIAASADRAPTDAELHTAYCIPVMRWVVSEANEQIKNSSNQNNPQELALLSEAKAVFDRLRAYLIPKIDTLDPVALTLASKRGETDIRDLNSAVNQCHNKCSWHLNADGFDKYDACYQECMANNGTKDLVARIQACKKPTWLPF
jgi:hypothetical protein